MILYTDQHPPVIIAAVPQVPETYYNCEIIFNTLDLNQISGDSTHHHTHNTNKSI